MSHEAAADLRLGELGDGRQDAVAIACEKDDVVWVAAHRRQLGVRDKLERVRTACLRAHT